MYTVNYIDKLDNTASVSSRELGMSAGPAPAMPRPPRQRGGVGWHM